MVFYYLLCFVLPSFVSPDTLETVYPGLVRMPFEEMMDDSSANSWKRGYLAMAKDKLPVVSSFLSPQGKNTYGPSNVQDQDLRTAWVFSGPNKGIGEYIEFTVYFVPDSVVNLPIGTYCRSKDKFGGNLYIFNGYCKSVKAWEENSRVKKLKVYYNGKPLCYLELQDIFYCQVFDLRKYFRDEEEESRHTEEEEGKVKAPYKLVDGDRLRFEIVEVYKGRKYDDVGISEFFR